jgi:hypothetical protein
MKKPSRTPHRITPPTQLTPDQLGKVTGGFNPQPDPPKVGDQG